MAFTMHSHSGQFCPGHAKDGLEEVVQRAMSAGMKTMGLTEHMPRTQLADLYPEELTADPAAELAALMPRHEAYVREARRLQREYAGRIEILVGFEAEFIRPEYAELVRTLASGEHASSAGGVDYLIGSLHHAAGGMPIDFDEESYGRAVEAAGGEEALYRSYYEQQGQMLRALRPPVVGHFDLVRLFSADPGRDVRGSWPEVWRLVRANLEFVAGYGGWLECNSSALRKGLAEPYPARQVAEEWLRLGGRFTLSDDSHGVAQLATNYGRALDYLESLGVAEVWTFERRRDGPVEGRQELVEKSVSLAQIRADLGLDKK